MLIDRMEERAKRLRRYADEEQADLLYVAEQARQRGRNIESELDARRRNIAAVEFEADELDRRARFERGLTAISPEKHDVALTT
jgi:hypothetical protein